MKSGFIFLILCFSIVLSHNEEIQKKVCTDKEFRCSDGSCIELEKLCDGRTNCADASDEIETNCAQIRCPYYAFRCAYGGCVDRNTTCNGVRDCIDNSDELLPECGNQKSSSSKILCKYNEFTCNNDQCIDEFTLCDGEDDCYDGSDETLTHCVNMQCPSYGFRCDYGGCIDKEHVCDGVDDCKDASDETKELCDKESHKPKKIPKPPMPVNIPSNDPKGGCYLPLLPEGGNYELFACQGNCKMIPGNLVNKRTVLRYFCNDGYVLLGRKFITCDQGRWNPEPQDCKRMCRALKSTSVNLKCEFKGQEHSCNRRVEPGTKMVPTCKPSYNLPDSPNVFNHTECLEDGRWAHDLFRCIPDCGIRSDGKAKPMMAHGKPVLGSYPWHTALYYKTYYLCGGSIITPKAVLTAAHCVYNDTTRRLFDRADVIVAVGKFNRSFEVMDLHETRFGVDDIHIPETYDGSRNRYASDIAILELNGIIEINAFAMPICIDQFNKYRLYLNTADLGFVVGWGYTEENQLSKVLRVGKFKYQSFSSCHETPISDFVAYVTSDKFCSASEVSQLTLGDSGGALTFMRKENKMEKHFIYGIVSIRHEKLPNVTIFTNITYHLNWINNKKIEIVKNILKKDQI